MKKRVAFLTLGCKVNQYETDAMTELFEAAGYTTVDFKEEADVYVINTCSVTNMADRKSRQMIHRARKLNPDAVIVAAGCYVQAKGEALKEEGFADILIGNNKKKDIVSILEKYLEDNIKIQDIIDLSKEQDYEPLFVTNVSGHTRAYLKIQDGCNQFCSYCIIPYTRGRIRSRKPEDIITEVRQLAENGFKEIVLTGIHLSSYGKDLGDTTSLLSIIGEIHGVEGIERIRLGSLEPRIITDEFVKTLVSYEKVCPHFHLSLQSGCDETLARMNRKYNTKEYEEALTILRKYYEHPALTTDVIAGFVGETEEEFTKTVEYLEKINLYEMHIFKFSVRKGTRAERMQGHVQEQVKTQRSNVLLEMAARHKKEYESYYLGKVEDVLLEEKVEIEGKTYFQGYTKHYVKVLIPLNDEGIHLEQNQIIAARIQDFLGESMLLGKVSIEF
ncbi:MAG: tRNA (N(6)-L-threonylcarbamoyladenosine(37)-C(2))-methylthiotransferase MtaB [Eubacteriales bacterium]|nr:tRNA (N(6)-L-threonylcarbamoyladenosine(37)-C(2))-methylthiotransferase MtaB [Eubacteriales bacterium]